MSMKELEIFQLVQGAALTIGSKVKVDRFSTFASEWQGEYLVLGICWDRDTDRFNITIGDDWDDPGCDGWTADDLRLVV